MRPSFGDKDAIFAYRTEIAWDDAASSLVFRESERQDAAYTQFGEVAVPNQSGHIYLVTNRHGQHRLITVARPTISGEMYGIITTLLAGRGSLLTPIAAPIAYLPIKMVPIRLLAGLRPIIRIMRHIASICGGRSTSRCDVRAGIGLSRLAFPAKWPISLIRIAVCLVDYAETGPIPKTSLKSDQACAEVVQAKRFCASWR